MYGEFSVWKGPFTETHDTEEHRQVPARGQRGGPRGGEAGAQDALYGDEMSDVEEGC